MDGMKTQTFRHNNSQHIVVLKYACTKEYTDCLFGFQEYTDCLFGFEVQNFAGILYIHENIISVTCILCSISADHLTICGEVIIIYTVLKLPPP